MITDHAATAPRPMTALARPLPRTIQRQIASLYALGLDFDVGDFVVRRSEVVAPLDRQEQLLVADRDDGGVDVSLVLDDALLAAGPISIDRFCAVAEGVSHLVYVAVACERRAQISALELELQAEIDKFALLVIALRLPFARAYHALFERFSFDADVREGEEHDRYREANQLARAFCGRVLRRLAHEASADALIGELRRVYRTRGATKRAYVSHRI